jgi:hypothetical protein
MRGYEGDQRRGTKTEKQASQSDGIIRKSLHWKLLSVYLRVDGSEAITFTSS